MDKAIQILDSSPLTPEQKILRNEAKKIHKYNTILKELFHTHLKHNIIHKFRKKLNSFDKIHSLFDIYTTRFDSYTYLQNLRVKENMNFNGSLYGSTLTLPQNTSTDKYLFIIDMNNTTNKIMGIGLIKNILAKDQNIKIYDNPTFNNHIYKSKYYLPFIDSHNHGVYFDFIEPNWIKFIEHEFENTIFYGKNHLKRGGSFSRFPLKKMKFKHLQFLLFLFILFNPNGFNESVLSKI